MQNFFKFLKYKYLLLISFLLLFISFKLLFIFLILIFLKLYIERKNNFFLIISYIFFSFLILDSIIPKLPKAENIFSIQSNIEYSINNNYGYYPKKNTVIEEKVFKNQLLIKKVNYTINEYGHRISLETDDINNCLLFHGGSITFGQSVNDDESLPYYTFKNLSNKFSVYNFAFNGYGPHQFLSKIENNYFKELKNCKNLIVIYLYIDDHIGRVVGKRSWGDKSPRYVFDNKDITQKGFFSNYPFKLQMKLRKNIRNSFSLSKIFNIEKTDTNDEKLFIEIIEQIEKKVTLKFQKVNFLYLIWDTKINENNLIHKALKNKNNIEINSLKIPDEYKKNGIQGDNHPTKEFYEILSKEIIKFINNYLS